MNGLPKLPQVINQREAKFALVFRKWLKENPMISCSLELKQTSTDSIPFSCFGAEQEVYSNSIRNGTLIRVQGTRGEPDYIYLRNAPTFIVIKYPKGFFIISTETFLLEKSRSKRKSLTAKRANDIATISVYPHKTIDERTIKE